MQGMRFGQTIAAGQVYREAVPPHRSWVVMRVVKGGLDVPHAAIRRVNDPHITKLISCPTLLDPRRYRVVDTREAKHA